MPGLIASGDGPGRDPDPGSILTCPNTPAGGSGAGHGLHRSRFRPNAGAMLSRKARYALHAMLFLARREGSATATEIAEAEAIPRKFLEQILSGLKTRGLVASRRGPAGGYVLARPPEAISFAEILRAIDGPLALAPCVSQTAFRPCDDCASLEACEIRPVLAAVRDATARLLEGTSLAAAIKGGIPEL